MNNYHSNSDSKTVRLLAIPVKLAAAACISLSVGGVLWSCLAKVPIYANGVAILMPTNKSKILSLKNLEFFSNDGISCPVLAKFAATRLLLGSVSPLEFLLTAPLSKLRSQMLCLFWFVVQCVAT